MIRGLVKEGRTVLISVIVAMLLISTLYEKVDGIKEITIEEDGQVIKNSPEMLLMGGVDFTGYKGDVLRFRKRGDVWVEFERFLVGEER